MDAILPLSYVKNQTFLIFNVRKRADFAGSPFYRGAILNPFFAPTKLLMAVRFVYFDLGNVLIRFSVQRMLYQLAGLAEKPEADVKTAIFDDKTYFSYEKGEISSQDFCDSFCAKLQIRVEPEEFFKATNDIFWIDEPILPIVRRFSKTNFPRGILSNTNPQHWKYVETAFPRVWRYFPRHKIASFEAKALKPFPEIYQIAFDEAKTELPDLTPDEILLIDDLEDNVVAAEKFGFQAIRYAGGAELLDGLRRLGLPTPE